MEDQNAMQLVFNHMYVYYKMWICIVHDIVLSIYFYTFSFRAD